MGVFDIYLLYGGVFVVTYAPLYPAPVCHLTFPSLHEEFGVPSLFFSPLIDIITGLQCKAATLSLPSCNQRGDNAEAGSTHRLSV